jgi:replication factor A1
MLKVPLAELKQKILESGKITPAELDENIKNKINELAGLISEEGAAHIIANELGLDLFNQQGKFTIKELYPGMRHIETVGKVVKKFELREFSKGESVGKVASCIIGDETGTIRVVLWNDQTDMFAQFSEGDIIAIASGYVRENNGQKEIHINERAAITINPPGETIESVKESFTSQRKKIAELQEGESNVELLGTIVQVFDPHFFTVCPDCNKRVTERENGSYCPDHGDVEAVQSYVLNVVLDDGSGNIRTVFWKHQTLNLLETDDAKMAEYRQHPGSFEDTKTDLLGEQVKVIGRTVKNTLFDRLEFNVQLVFRANPEEEIKRLERQQNE